MRTSRTAPFLSRMRYMVHIDTMLYVTYIQFMSIRHAILGFLGWKPLTGYELKKCFSDSLSFHWSGNNNQVYGTLLALLREGALTVEVQAQEKFPARKVYTITESGRAELRAWLVSEPELPVVKSDFASRLAWADVLDSEELRDLLEQYAQLLDAHILMCEERLRRGMEKPARSAREAALWKMLEDRALSQYKAERCWIEDIKLAISTMGGGTP